MTLKGHKQTNKQKGQTIMMLTQNSHREDSEEGPDHTVYVLTLPGTETIVSKPNMKLMEKKKTLEMYYLENTDE